MELRKFRVLRPIQWLRQVRLEAQRLGTVLLLLVFSGAAILPTCAQVVTKSSIVPASPDAQELVQQGRTLYEAERFAEAVAVLQRAITAFKATGRDGLRQAMALSNLSLTYQQLGQWNQASRAIADSLNLFKPEQKMGNSKERSQILAQTLDVQGRLQLAQGQAEPALTTWRQAATIYQQLGDKTALTRSQINQAQALQALGLYLQARKTLEEVQQVLQKQPDSSLKAKGLRSLGNVLRVVGDLDDSRNILQQSLKVAIASQSAPDMAASQLGLGNTMRDQQETKAALEFYQQAAAASTSPTMRVQAQVNQLSLLVDKQQLSYAQTLWPQIQSQLSALPLSRTAIYARINLAQSLMKMGSRRGGDGEITPNSAPQTPNSAPQTPNSELRTPNSAPQTPHSELRTPNSALLLATAVQQAKDLGDRRTESYALGTLGGLYEQTQQLSNAQDLTQQALFIAQSIDAPDIAYQWQWQLGRLKTQEEDIKGAILSYGEAVKSLKSLRSDLVAINSDVQFSFRESVEPVYRQFVDLLLRSQPNSEPSQANLQQARDVIESLQLAELDNFFRSACLVATQQLDQVVDQEAPTAAVVYPIILPDRLEVILKLPKQQLRHYTTRVADTEVEDTLEQLRQNLTQPQTRKQVQSLSHQVYDWLLRPAEQDLRNSKIETLVFVLDGSLRNIPMAALYDGQQYLIQKYSVALTPGLQLIDPKPLKRAELKALAAGLTENRQYFSPLPNVKRELEDIQSEMPSRVLLNQEFTSAALQNRLNSQSFPIVHLATHGQFSSNADKTFILAWDKPIKVNELNSFLRRSQNRPQAIELLVLSACETATGDKRAALGLAGVAVRAGARSTLASLWNLNDESSALLMTQFYHELAKTQVTKAEALRQAQLSLLNQPDYRHPMYWAPYILVGNWL